jgi:hypothetical protein
MTFKERVLNESPWHEGGDVNSMWMKIVICIRKVVSKELGVTKGGGMRRYKRLLRRRKSVFRCMHLDRSVDNVERYKLAKKTAK